MTDEEKAAILAISLMAAFADGRKDERESARLKAIAESLSTGSPVNVTAVYQDVLLRRRRPGDSAQALQSPEARQLAYETAVCVCDADGARNDAEAKFLESLRHALGLDAGAAQAYAGTAAAIASAPLGDAPAGPPVPAQPVNAAELDRTILNYAILNGALELLPQTLATLAIIPLQMKMVYRIGKAHGYELDRGHITELLGALGVGLTSQYVEGIGRKLIGGLLKRIGGNLAGMLGEQATSSAVAFATTYALGQAAKQYYGGGRTLGMDQLNAAFGSLLGEAETLRSRYADEIAQKARTINVGDLLATVKQQ